VGAISGLSGYRTEPGPARIFPLARFLWQLADAARIIWRAKCFLRQAPVELKRSVDSTLSEVSNSEDAIKLLDEAEALELVKFDPGVDPKDSWYPPKPVASFLEKHLTEHCRC